MISILVGEYSLHGFAPEWSQGFSGVSKDRARRVLLGSLNQNSWLRLWANPFANNPNPGSNISYVKSSWPKLTISFLVVMLRVWVWWILRVELLWCCRPDEYWVICTKMIRNHCSHQEHNETVHLGFRSCRSLMFCSWGAEEYGLVGSMEYVQVGPLDFNAKRELMG